MSVNNRAGQRHEDETAWQRFKTRIVSTWRVTKSDFQTVKFVSGSYANVVIAVAMALGTFLGSRLSEPWNSIVIWVGFVGAGLAVVLKTGLAWKLMRSGKVLRVTDEEYLRGNPQDARVSASWASEKQQSWPSKASGGEWKTYFWDDPAVNEILRSFRLSRRNASADPETAGDTLMATVRANDYKLPAALDLVSPNVLWAGRSKDDEPTAWKRFWHRPVRFNGHQLRLATEPTVTQLQQRELQIQRVRYFDGECSNEAWKYRLKKGTVDEDLVKKYVFNAQGNIKGLHESELANIIGVTVLAITSDGHAVFVKQANTNSVAPGHFAATGSGSIDRQSLREYRLRTSNVDSIRFYRLRRRLRLLTFDQLRDEPVDFIGLMFEAMYGRITAETGLGKSKSSGIEAFSVDRIVDLESFRCTGYFRWMSRSAKPEFAGLVRLKLTKAEIRGEFGKAVTVDSQHLAFVDLKQHKGENAVLTELATLAGSPDVMNPSSEYTLRNALDYIATDRSWLDTEESSN